MGVPIIHNGGGSAFAMPDVCKTPTPAGPVPIPYPNMAEWLMTNMATSALTVRANGFNVVKLGTKTMLSSGDEAGVVGGVVSNIIVGPGTVLGASVTVLVQGGGAGYLGSIVGQNGAGAPNAPTGSSIVPSPPGTVLVAP